MSKNLLVIFDGDDTLWATEPLYDAARDRVARLVAGVGLDADAWSSLEHDLDLERVGRLGYAWHRFPTSCALAARAAAHAAGWQHTLALEMRCGIAAASVYSERPIVDPAAAAVLSSLRERAQVVLLTKGQAWVQRRRLHQAHLGHAFDRVHIVPRKTRAVFAEVIEAAGVAASCTLAIGNSVSSDVQPALEAGARAAWLDRYAWIHEDHATDEMDASVHRIVELADVLDLVDMLEPANGVAVATTAAHVAA